MVTGVPGLVLGLMMLMVMVKDTVRDRDRDRVRDTGHRREALSSEEEKREVRENCDLHLLSSPTKLIKSTLEPPRLSGLNLLIRSVVSPFMLIMFLAAACRQVSSLLLVPTEALGMHIFIPKNGLI